MSIFASHHTKTIALPFAAPHTVTLKKLSGKQLGKAEQEAMFSHASTFRRLGGREFKKELDSIGAPAEQAKEIEQVKADPLSAFDIDTLLYGGVSSWTCDESLARVPVKDEETGAVVMRIPALDDLVADAREFIAREVLKLAKPSLFLSEEEQEIEQGKG